MRPQTVLAFVVVLVVGLVSLPAGGQDTAPKGVTSKALVTSLGGFKATVNAPLAISGATVELAPGGQTGRQRFQVPTYVYVIEGVLTTNYEGGPVGVAGIQYHASGQSHMDTGGIWHNYRNTTNKPVKFLMVHIGYPGAEALQQPKPD